MSSERFEGFLSISVPFAFCSCSMTAWNGIRAIPLVDAKGSLLRYLSTQILFVEVKGPMWIFKVPVQSWIPQVCAQSCLSRFHDRSKCRRYPHNPLCRGSKIHVDSWGIIRVVLLVAALSMCISCEFLGYPHDIARSSLQVKLAESLKWPRQSCNDEFLLNFSLMAHFMFLFTCLLEKLKDGTFSGLALRSSFGAEKS